jgi:hypothetical protein
MATFTNNSLNVTLPEPDLLLTELTVLNLQLTKPITVKKWELFSKIELFVSLQLLPQRARLGLRLLELLLILIVMPSFADLKLSDISNIYYKPSEKIASIASDFFCLKMICWL